MRLAADLPQKSFTRFFGGAVALKQLFSGQNNLIGSFTAAAFSAHAVGDERQEGSIRAMVGDDTHLVLLVLAVPAVCPGSCNKSWSGRLAGGHDSAFGIAATLSKRVWVHHKRHQGLFNAEAQLTYWLCGKFFCKTFSVSACNSGMFNAP